MPQLSTDQHVFEGLFRVDTRKSSEYSDRKQRRLKNSTNKSAVEEHVSCRLRRTLLAGAASVCALSPLAIPQVRAAAPLAAKQNPGRYRYKVGSFEVTVVTDGMITSPLADNYVGNASKSEVNAALVAKHLPPDKVSHSYSPAVVHTGAKTR